RSGLSTGKVALSARSRACSPTDSEVECLTLAVAYGHGRRTSRETGEEIGILPRVVPFVLQSIDGRDVIRAEGEPLDGEHAPFARRGHSQESRSHVPAIAIDREGDDACSRHRRAAVRGDRTRQLADAIRQDDLDILQ